MTLRPLAAALLALTLATPALVACSDNTSSTVSQSTPEDGKSYNAANFQTLIDRDDVELLDVRTPSEYAEGHIPGATNLDVQNASFTSDIAGLDKDKWYGVYCRSGKRSKVAMQELEAAGYKTFDLDGGIKAWNGELEK